MENAVSLSNIGKECIKCHYKRKASDTAPDYACPQCGIVYKKAEDALLKQKMLAQDARLSNYQTQVEPIESKEIANEISNAKLVYILFFFGYFTGFAMIAALYLATQFDEDSAHDSWVSTHFAWQVKCFWDLVKWSGIALGIILFGLITSIFKWMHLPSETGYGVYANLFKGIFNPLLIIAVVIGVVILAISGLRHIYQMMSGFSALRNKKSIE